MWIGIFLMTFFVGVGFVLHSYLFPDAISNMFIEFAGSFLGFASALAAERAIANGIDERRANRVKKRILEEMEYIWLETFRFQSIHRHIYTPVWQSSIMSGLIENIEQEFERHLYILHEMITECHNSIRALEDAPENKKELLVKVVNNDREKIHTRVLKLLLMYSDSKRIEMINEGENGSKSALQIFEERYAI